MAGSSGVRRLLCVLCVMSCSFAQSAPKRSRQAGIAAPEEVPLGGMSTIQLPSLPAESIGPPLFCDSDGRILFRLATPMGVEDPVLISRDGKTVIRFGREKVNDIPHPQFTSMFLSGSDVYILTWGSTPLGYETKWRTPTGEVVSQKAAKSSAFVAHFEADGRYAGAVPLDLPFKPLRLGVFDNGDFLIAGAEPSTDEPRVGIVASNGQLRRMLELKGDVHARDESSGSGKEKDPTALPRYGNAQGSPERPFVQSLHNAVYTSQIAKDGPNILLFRPTNGPLFSITPSGEMRVNKLKVEGDYSLYTIKATQNSWIVEFLHNLPHSPAVELSIYAFDPETGAPLREYLLPSDLGWGLACTDGGEFTFVMSNNETNTLSLVTVGVTKH